MNLEFLHLGRSLLRQNLLRVDKLMIGRANDCDVSLTGSEISRHHLEIKKNNNLWIVKNLSKRPVKINNQFIEDDSPIIIGDKIELGGFVIKVTKSPSTDINTKITSNEPTKIIDELKANNITTTPNITIVMPPEPPHTFSTNNEISIGQHSECKIRIRDPYASRWHASILSNGSNIIIQDLGSSNGTFINGHKISRAILENHGEFVIGKTVIKYKLVQNTDDEESIDSKIIGNSPKINSMITQLSRISPTDVSVCVMGESGTGKELVARYLHDNSKRKNKPFIAVNCGAIPKALIEGIFFGHEKGAFTGAIESNVGVFEQANHGTLFLDEIAELPLDMQTRLLRVLESKEIKRLGSCKEVKVNFRLITATNKDLQRLVVAGTFRDDLFHRIFIVPMSIPPLRDRGNDIELIANYYLKEFSPTGLHKFSKTALEKLFAYSWPGNIRELKNTIQRALVCSLNNVIEDSDISIYKMPSIYDEGVEQNAGLKNNEKKLLLDTLQKFKWNISKTACELGIARSTLRSKLEKFKIK